ncbi:MULE domain-containing protein, partial [Aphis craccivora]
MKSKPDDERVTRFADYLVDVYISEEAQYPPERQALLPVKVASGKNP